MAFSVIGEEQIRKMAMGICRELCAQRGEPPCWKDDGGEPKQWCDEPGCLHLAEAAAEMLVP